MPDNDRLALKFLIPKTDNSRNLEDFRDITLFNAFIKVMFGIWSRRVNQFMVKNGFIDTGVQKGFIPKVSGCVEHNQTLHDILRADKRGGKSVQVSFLDLKNAFGSVKHNLIVAALRWYHIPDHMISLLKRLYSDCHVIVSVNEENTTPIPIKKGSLQGGPEAGICFNIPWNIVLDGICKKAFETGSIPEDKPVSGFADDLTTKTNNMEKQQEILDHVSCLFKWSKSFTLNVKKCKSLCIDSTGHPIEHNLKIGGQPVSSLHNTPFKFLGRWIHPTLTDSKNLKNVTTKVENLMKKIDVLALDGVKKTWIYQFGFLPYIAWDLMMYQLKEATVMELERTVNRYLKRWLGLARCADPSIIYRNRAGLNIVNIRHYVLANRLNVEMSTATCRDPLVRTVAKRRRDEEADATGWTPTKKMKTAVEDIEFRKKFMSNIRAGGDRRGLDKAVKINLNKKTVIKRAKELTDEEKIGKILQLSVQSKWYEWDELINLDLK